MAINDMRRPLDSRRNLVYAAASTLLLAALPARSVNADTLEALRAEIANLKAEQAERDTRLRDLETRLNALESAPPTPIAGIVAPAGTHQSESDSRLSVSGDIRLRYEANFGDAGAEDWDRGVLRARLQAEYAVASGLTVGGRLATGDPDDPNSSDITLSNFADDFEVSLDQAFVRYDRGNLSTWGGKFALPFLRTDLVWDGDVNPQGIGGIYRLPLADGRSIRVSGLYFLVDESVAGSDSSMVGAQIGFEAPVGSAMRFDAAVSGYDYSLGTVAGADGGDLRSNVIGPDGQYVSDFNLLEAMAGVTWMAGGERWPIRLLGQYVYNTGARTSGDTAYNLELTAGRAGEQHDWRIGYGFSQAGVDAVLAAFSHDNTTFATNYRQHALFVTYMPLDKITLDATYFRYRPYASEFAGANDPDDWLNRLRLNVQVTF